MSELYKKVSARERPVGWYHSGPVLSPEADLKINEEIFRRYCLPAPLLVVIDPVAEEDSMDVPVEAYMAIEELHKVSKTLYTQFNYRTEPKLHYLLPMSPP
jgi:26S proteasome regulatory subunit N8